MPLFTSSSALVLGVLYSVRILRHLKPLFTLYGNLRFQRTKDSDTVLPKGEDAPSLIEAG
jgi:hypothetical protein